MVIRPASACLGLSLLVNATVADGQGFQEVFPSLAAHTVHSTLCTADGGFVLDRGWKVDENGAFEWRMDHAATGLATSRMPDGGFVLLAEGDFPPSTTPVQDSLVFSYPLVRIGGDGNVVWSKLITFTLPGDTYGEADPYPEVGMSTDADGRIFLFAGCTYFVPSDGVIACLDGSGSMLWAKMLAGQSPGAYFSGIASDGNGGCYVLWGYGYSLWSDYPGPFDLARFESDGSLAWVRHGTVPCAMFHFSSLISVNGEAVIGGTGGFFGGPIFHPFVFKVGADGTPDWLKLYDHPSAILEHDGEWELDALANGELIASHYEIGELDHDPVIAHLSQDGTVLNSAKAHLTQQGGYPYLADWRGVDVLDSTIAIGIRLYSIGGPGGGGLWVLTPEFTGCMLEPIEVTNPGTSGTVSIETHPEAYLLENVPIVTDSTMIFSTNSFSPVDLCWYITATPGIEAANDPFHLLENVVQQGASLMVTSTTAGRIEVLDASGRLVAANAMAVGAPNELSTSGWPVGLYLLRAFDMSGRVAGTARVIVE